MLEALNRPVDCLVANTFKHLPISTVQTPPLPGFLYSRGEGTQRPHCRDPCFIVERRRRFGVDGWTEARVQAYGVLRVSQGGRCHGSFPGKTESDQPCAEGKAWLRRGRLGQSSSWRGPQQGLCSDSAGGSPGSARPGILRWSASFRQRQMSSWLLPIRDTLGRMSWSFFP